MSCEKKSGNKIIEIARINPIKTTLTSETVNIILPLSSLKSAFAIEHRIPPPMPIIQYRTEADNTIG